MAHPLHSRYPMGAVRRLTVPTAAGNPTRVLARAAAPTWDKVGGQERGQLGVRPATRRPSPHVIPREPPAGIASRLALPDWLREPPPENTPPPVVQRGATSADGWPTQLLTIETSAYRPRGTPPRAAAGPPAPGRSRFGLTCLTAALAAMSLALALWQLYWMLESTGPGRALVDVATSAIAALTGHT